MKKPTRKETRAWALEGEPVSSVLAWDDEEAPETKRERRESEMPRALSGWPEGSVYIPREPVFFTDFFPAEVPSAIRRYRFRGKYERKARGATGAAE